MFLPWPCRRHPAHAVLYFWVLSNLPFITSVTFLYYIGFLNFILDVLAILFPFLHVILVRLSLVFIKGNLTWLDLTWSSNYRQHFNFTVGTFKFQVSLTVGSAAGDRVLVIPAGILLTHSAEIIYFWRRSVFINLPFITINLKSLLSTSSQHVQEFALLSVTMS